MTLVKTITTAAPQSVGWHNRACRVHGNGYAICVSGIARYGPSGVLGKVVEMIMTEEQARVLITQLMQAVENPLPEAEGKRLEIP